MKPRTLRTLFPLFLSLGSPLAAQSLWTVNAGNWSTAANWSPAGVPAAGANIAVSDASTGTLTLDGSTSRTIGSYTHGTTGTKTNEFALQTNTNTLTLNSGLIANGNIGGVGLRMRGNYVVSADQEWNIAGQIGSATADRGVTIQERSSGNRGTLLLNGNLTKTGSGQLCPIGITLEGPGDLIVNAGALKLNAGSSLELRATGPGKFVFNNASTLMLSKNSGTFGDSVTLNRGFVFHGTSTVSTSGSSAGTWTIHSPMEWNGSHTVTINNSTTNTGLHYLFAGVMSGPGTLTKNGASQLILGGSSSNTLAGMVTVEGGELRLQKSGDATAIAGNLTVAGGILRVDQPHQIADSSTVTITGGQFINTGGHTDTIAALHVSSSAVSSFSNMTVSGATVITAGTHDVNSGYSFSTHSLAISNNSALRYGANGAGTTITVGSGGLSLADSQIIFGSAGGAVTAQLNLQGDVLSTGISQFHPPNHNGPRIIDLQGGTRQFAVQDGSLGIHTTVQNGTLVKTGPGLLRLSRAGSSAALQLTEGPVEITGTIDATAVSLSGGTVRMDIGGVNPAKLQVGGNFSHSGGSIDISILGGPIVPGTLELVRYTGSLSGIPVVQLPASFLSSRMNPVVDMGSGTDSAITIQTTGVPLELVWHGGAGSLWDLDTTANFDGGSEKFYPLDSVVFDDTGVHPNVTLNTDVLPAAVIFDHGATVPTYTLGGSGSISGPARLEKYGTGTSIVATDNSHTGPTLVQEGTLQIGNGGGSGTLGTGPTTLSTEGVLRFARQGELVVSSALSGTGTLEQAGPGTTILPFNNDGFSGFVDILGGTLQLGNGAATGSLGSAPIDVAAGAALAIRRSGISTVPNSIGGAGSVTILGGSPILSGTNLFAGGVRVAEEGALRLPSDASLGEIPAALVSDHIRLQQGGLKNQDSDTVIHENRGISLQGEGYLTAGWTKTLTIHAPMTGSGDLFINYDSGRVILTNPTSDRLGALVLGASRPGFNGTTGGNLQISSISNGGLPSPIGAASADAANIVFNGGRLIYDGVSGSTDRGLTLQGAGTVEVVTSPLVLNGLITGGGSFTKAGAGGLFLGGNNDFTGAKTISAGTVVLTHPSALGSTSGQLTFTGTTGVLELATDTSVAPYNITVGVGNSATILSGVSSPGPGIEHTLGDLALSTVTLNIGRGADVSEGQPRVRFGSLNLSAGSSGTTTLNPTSADMTLGGASIGSNAVAKTLSLGGTSQDNHVTGTIADGLSIVSLRKDNKSHWTLSGASTFTGNVTADDGVLQITHSDALGATGKTFMIAGNAGAGRVPEVRLAGGISPVVSILQLSGFGIGNATGALRNLSGNNTLTATTQIVLRDGNGGAALYSDAGTLTLISPVLTCMNADRTLALAGPGNGVIQASIQNGSTANLPVTKNGSGTWTLNGAHTYTGPTTVNAGVLSLGQAALHDEATVNIATGAVLDLNFSGTDIVGGLVLGGNPMPPGTYHAGHPQVGAYFTGTGSLRVPGESTPFEAWIASHPSLVGDAALPGADPDGDGVSNLLEFLLHADPTNPQSRGKSYLRTEDTNATAGRELILVAAIRKNANFQADALHQAQVALVDGVQCSVEGSLNLSAFQAEIETLAMPLPESLTQGLPALDADWEYRAFRLKGSDGLPGKGFLRIGASQ